MQIGPAANAQNYPDKLAVVFRDRRYTWREWNARMNQLAQALLGLGLQGGDKVAVLLQNCNEAVEVLGAVSKLGCLAVPLNYRLTPDEIEYVVNNSDAKAFIFGREQVSAVSEKVSGVGKSLKGKVKEVPISTDLLSGKIDQFLDEKSDQLIKDWELATKTDISELEKKDGKVATDLDDLSRRFNEYRGHANNKFKNIEKRLSALEGEE